MKYIHYNYIRHLVFVNRFSKRRCEPFDKLCSSYRLVRLPTGGLFAADERLRLLPQGRQVLRRHCFRWWSQACQQGLSTATQLLNQARKYKAGERPCTPACA
jgi:hypothetical protein